MEEQAVQGTNMRSVLNRGFKIDPMKKSFDRLTALAHTGIQTITRTQWIIYRPFARNQEVNISGLLEEFCPTGVGISTVSK